MHRDNDAGLSPAAAWNILQKNAFPDLMDADREAQIRNAAFDWLERFSSQRGGAVRRDEMSAFHWEGQRIRLMAPQTGIWKPKGFRSALSITSVEGSPYRDAVRYDGLLSYKWRRGGPNHPDNVALREAIRYGDPLIWFRGLGDGLYLPVFPVWAVAEEPQHEQVLVSLGDAAALTKRKERPYRASGEVAESGSLLRAPRVSVPAPLDLQRRYTEALVRQRIHQPAFRAQVLHAYRCMCAICRLRRTELLDAAHIKPDAAGGEPRVSNGIAMCKLHHAAFDRSLLAIRPDYVVEVRDDVLDEEDGPTLVHALQGLHGTSIQLPDRRSRYPDKALLEERYEQFKQAS